MLQSVHVKKVTWRILWLKWSDFNLAVGEVSKQRSIHLFHVDSFGLWSCEVTSFCFSRFFTFLLGPLGILWGSRWPVAILLLEQMVSLFVEARCVTWSFLRHVEMFNPMASSGVGFNFCLSCSSPKDPRYVLSGKDFPYLSHPILGMGFFDHQSYSIREGSGFLGIRGSWGTWSHSTFISFFDWWLLQVLGAEDSWGWSMFFVAFCFECF